MSDRNPNSRKDTGDQPRAPKSAWGKGKSFLRSLVGWRAQESQENQERPTTSASFQKVDGQKISDKRTGNVTLPEKELLQKYKGRSVVYEDFDGNTEEYKEEQRIKIIAEQKEAEKRIKSTEAKILHEKAENPLDTEFLQSNEAKLWLDFWEKHDKNDQELS